MKFLPQAFCLQLRHQLSRQYPRPRWRVSGHGGFSVMEAVIAIAVFALALAGIAGSFVAVMRLDAKGRSVRQVEQNSRFLSEFLTREIRNGAVNFGSTGYNGTIPNSGRTAVLYLINRDNEIESVTLSNNNVQLTRSGATTNLSGGTVSFSRLDFYIRPTSAGDQSRVTFVYEITSNNGTRTQDQVTLNVQSTVTVRDY